MTQSKADEQDEAIVTLGEGSTGGAKPSDRPSGHRLANRLQALAEDYERVTGTKFKHFFCPLLFKDEDVELCRAHVVNEGFPASRSWTVQRKLVDNWFGSVFESEFLDLQLRGLDLMEVIADPQISKRLGARLFVNGQIVRHYVTEGRPVPAHYQSVMIPAQRGPVEVALKLSPTEFQQLADAPWQVVYEKDLRVPAFVSLLKAAHLTLFSMLGYEWALSGGGRFLGRLLGDFYTAHRGRRRADVLASARPYFRPFASMLRFAIGPTYKGSVEDNRLFICEDGSIRWGFVILIRTDPQSLHAVLVPRFEAGGEAVFRDFLSRPPEHIVARRMVFQGDRWGAYRDTEALVWPNTGVLYPED